MEIHNKALTQTILLVVMHMRMCNEIDCQLPHALCDHVQYLPLIFTLSSHSGFPSTRINLSPFTKDFRGGEQFNEFID